MMPYEDLLGIIQAAGFDEVTHRPIVARQARKILDALTMTIKDEIAEGREVRIPGFGIFYRKTIRGHRVEHKFTKGGLGPRTSMALSRQTYVAFRAARGAKGL